MPTRVRHALHTASLAAAIVLIFAMGTGPYAAASERRIVLTGTAFSAFTDTGTGVGALASPLVRPFVIPPAAGRTRVYQSSFGSFPEFSDPQALTVDQSTGDIYAVSPTAHTVSRYTSAGAPDNFTAGPNSGTNILTGFSFDGPSAAQVAIAPAGATGGTAGDIYVASLAGVDVYANDGTHLGQIKEANGSGFSESCGVATDNAGELYIGDYGGEIDRYVPSVNPVTSADYDAQITGVSSPCGVAADSTGAVYASKYPTGPLTKYTASDFGTSNPGAVIDATSRAVSVDPSNDDVYVDEGNKISVFDSTGTQLYSFGSATDFGTESAGVAVMGSGGHAYVADRSNKQIDVYGAPVTLPEVVTGVASALSPTSATLGGSVDPNGLALTDCHFEYVSDAAFLATGFTDLSSGGTASCSPSVGSIPADLESHAVDATITGLDPSTIYHFRLAAANANAPVKGLAALVPGVALVETTGSPTRTAGTARLDSRVDPRGAATSYHFEYGDQGPCDSNACTATPAKSAGNGETFELVSQQLSGLKANTTYHYRIAADNGVPGGVTYGQDATLVTRASDAPLTHGDFPGPPGSDRAWEQVNMPDLGGNSVLNSLATSSNGDRIIYGIEGGDPGSQNGGGLFGASNYHLAERTATGWKTNFIYPSRAQATGNEWTPPAASDDLSRIYDINRDGSLSGDADVWSLSPGQPAQELSKTPIQEATEFLTTAANGSRVITILGGTRDPEYPFGPNVNQVYDATSGSPRLIGVLPNGSAACASTVSQGFIVSPEDWVSPDGSHAFFMVGCFGSPDQGLYMRNFADSTTTKIVAGGFNDEPHFLHATSTAVFFTTNLSLDPKDAGGTDVYRYDLGSGEYDCITCFPGHVGNVVGETNDYISVSEDGSRVYFAASARLLSGAATKGIYRVDVANHELAYVAPGGSGFGGDTAGLHSAQGKAINPDGSVFVFRSSNPALNALGGQQNGGTAQYYRYDDRDRSLVCASCPGDGSAPVAEVEEGLGGDQAGPNQTPLDAAGDLAFTTSTPLVAADQNTARSGQNPGRGDDLYEWRDGRLLLVSDGTSDNERPPEFNGFSRDGRDLFFAQYAQLTPDALDSNRRIYDARIGGGFEFPKPPPPCSLDACQGNPVPAPFDSTPASTSFSGPGNPSHGGATTTTTRTKTAKKVKCKKGKKRSKCSTPVKCKKGKKGGKCRKARHANTTRRVGR